ncbi:MAG: hypothetical protein LBU83_11920 [Bacteroidales bacterium]|jgi:hypothetical protein|nr:hypothetical protein [Bacteroidales bacterium]
MRSGIFKSMNANKQRFIEKIKLGENPNPLRNGVEEELNKVETAVEIAETSLLQIDRVYDKRRETVIESLGAMRRVKIFEFINRSRENLLKRLYEWFEIEVSWVPNV